MARWIRRIFSSSSELRDPDRAFTLDQDGGLVVSFDAVLKSKGMKKQLEAAKELKARQKELIKNPSDSKLTSSE